MPRRSVLTEWQRFKLLGLPTDEASMLRHYILSDYDLEQIVQRRRAQNKIGFALQLCALRYPGRLFTPGETIPLELLKFLGDQLGIDTVT